MTRSWMSLVEFFATALDCALACVDTGRSDNRMRPKINLFSITYLRTDHRAIFDFRQPLASNLFHNCQPPLLALCCHAKQRSSKSHGQAFRASPLHCSGGSHTRWKEHAGAGSGRTPERTTGDGSRGQSFPAAVLRGGTRGRVPGAIRVSD